jgi:hypothetical protein
MSPRHAPLCALAVLVLGSCSSAADKASSACQELARARCEQHQRCSPADFPVFYSDLADCMALVTESCQMLATLPDSRYDGTAIGACASAISASSCDAYWLYVDLPECREPAGTRKRGDTCTRSVQCASRFCVYTSTGSRCGRCEDVSPAGGVCGASIPCDDGLFCDAGRCRATVGEGAACESVWDCRGFLTCTGGLCERPLPLGSACNDDSSCEGIFAECYGGKCTAVRLLGEGASCGSTLDDPPSMCAGRYSCDLEGSRTCQRSPTAGEPCSDDGLFCRGTAYCWNGKCENPQAAFCPASGEK